MTALAKDYKMFRRWTDFDRYDGVLVNMARFGMFTEMITQTIDWIGK